MKKKRLEIGKQGEQIAQKYLRRKRYKLLETNFRCAVGEIDIIAKDQHVVVFVEVRTRTSDTFMPPYNTVRYSKKKQVKRVARFYISKHNLVNTQFRFDVIGITLDPQTDDYDIAHIPNAF